MPVDADILHNIPLFALLDADELAELSAHIDEENFKANQTIYQVGDNGCEMHIVLSGKVEVFVLDDDKKKVIIEEAGPGEFVGELSLLDEEPHSSTAVALEPTHTFIIDRDDLGRLFRKKPNSALDIISILGKRIRMTDVILSHRVARDPNVIIEEKLTFGQRLADRVASFGGSWNFITLFGVMLVTWIIINAVVLELFHKDPFDPYPFILLNLILSMLAAMQAPVIMMSQNRQDTKDRIRSEQDFKVNLKAEVEIQELHEKLDKLREEMFAARSGESSTEKTG